MREDGNEFLQEVISTLPLPPGVSLTIPRGMAFGSQIIDKKAIWWFMLAAPFIIWLISAALLESWKDAWVVVLIIPCSLIGLMAITLLKEITFGQSGWSAALLLTGIAVNNGILLIHHSYKYEKEGVVGIRKWFYVYKDKSRAVALTTITTIAGLLPMIIWQSNSFWYELASFVIWGLVISTLIIMLLMGSWEKSSV